MRSSGGGGTTEGLRLRAPSAQGAGARRGAYWALSGWPFKFNVSWHRDASVASALNALSDFVRGRCQSANAVAAPLTLSLAEEAVSSGPNAHFHVLWRNISDRPLRYGQSRVRGATSAYRLRLQTLRESMASSEEEDRLHPEHPGLPNHCSGSNAGKNGLLRRHENLGRLSCKKINHFQCACTRCLKSLCRRRLPRSHVASPFESSDIVVAFTR